MKITKLQLKRIIKEEYLKQSKILNEQLTPLEAAFTKDRDLLRLLNTLKDFAMRRGHGSEAVIAQINRLLKGSTIRDHQNILKTINAGFEYAVTARDNGRALEYLNRVIGITKENMIGTQVAQGRAMIAKHKPGFDAASKASRQFQQNLPKDAAAASARGGLMGALAAGGAGVMAVDAIDAMAGPELRKLIAMATGEDPGRIPTPSLKRRLKALASPVTGMVDLAEIGADKLSLALGMREPTQDEAGEEAWDKRIAAAKYAGEVQGFGRTFSPGSIRQAPRRIGRHKLPAGAMLGDPIRETQLKRIIKQEIENVFGEGIASKMAFKQADKFKSAFGPEDVEESARNFAAAAGGSYDGDDYKEYLDKAKEYLFKHGEGYRWSGN